VQKKQAVFTEMLIVYQSMHNLHQLIKICFDKQSELDVMSDVTLQHLNMAHLTAEDRLQIKTSQTKKG